MFADIFLPQSCLNPPFSDRATDPTTRLRNGRQEQRLPMLQCNRKMHMLMKSGNRRTMFAFILFGAFTLAGWGLLHLVWNKRRDARDARDAASASSSHFIWH